MGKCHQNHPQKIREKIKRVVYCLAFLYGYKITPHAFVYKIGTGILVQLTGFEEMSNTKWFQIDPKHNTRVQEIKSCSMSWVVLL